MHVERETIQQLASTAMSTVETCVGYLPGEKFSPIKKVIAIIKKLIGDDETMDYFTAKLNRAIDAGMHAEPETGEIAAAGPSVLEQFQSVS